jgi:N-formylglutamate amidohydrolase
MIELNRKLYMDEETGEKRMSFPAIQRIAARLLSQLIRLPFSS